MASPLNRRELLRRASALGLPMPGAAALAASPAEPPSPFVPSDRLFGESIGLGVKFYQGEPVPGLFALEELGVRWVREEHHWSHFEPAPGRYLGFTGAFINRLKFYRQRGIGVVFMLGYGNGTAYPDTPEQPHRSIDPQAYAAYAVQVAQRLRDAGVRYVLEVWNEPHNGEIQKKVGGSWQGAGPAAWVAHYCRMVQAVRDAVRAFDPTVPVFAQDDMWIVHYWFLEQGLPKDLDGLTIHPYQSAPERAAVQWDTDWCRPFQVVDRDGSFRSGVRRLREQWVKKQGTQPRIWITEMGYGASIAGREGGIPAERVAAYVPRSFIEAFAAGVEVSLWFSSFDGPDGPMGLRDLRGDRRPAYAAFKTMNEELGKRRLLAQVAGGDRLGRGVQAYLFGAAAGEDPRERRLVVWNADEREHRMKTAAVRGARADVDSPLQVNVDSRSGRGDQTNADLLIHSMPLYLRGRFEKELLQRALAL